MHALLAGTAVDIRVENCWNDAICAFHAVVGEDRVSLRAGNTGLAVEVRSCDWTRLGLWKLRSSVELFDDIRRSFADGSPLLYLWVGVEQDLLAVESCSIVGLLCRTRLAGTSR